MPPGRPAVDLTGAKSNWLEVVARAGTDSNGTALWRVHCHACGDDATITGTAFRNGAKSCGCARHGRRGQEPPFPQYRKQPSGTTLTGQERTKREEAAAGAAGVALDPPGPDDRCAYRPTDWGSGRVQLVPACGRPSAYAGFDLCAEHAAVARDAGASSYVRHSAELVALDLASEITGGCARCGARWTVRADQAPQRFEIHRRECAA